MLLSLCPGKSELFLFRGVVAEQLNNQWGRGEKTNLFSSKSTCILLSSTGMIVYYMTSFSLQLM